MPNAPPSSPETPSKMGPDALGSEVVCLQATGFVSTKSALHWNASSATTA